MVIGTSGMVYPAAGLAGIAAAGGAQVININPDPHSAPPGALQPSGSASTILPRIIELAWPAGHVLQVRVHAHSW